MEDKVLQAVKSLINQHGFEILSNTKKLRSILFDMVPNEKKEIKVILTACEEKVIEELVNEKEEISAPTFRRLSSRLHQEAAIDEKYAEWAIRCLAGALDKKVAEIPTSSPEPSQTNGSHQNIGVGNTKQGQGQNIQNNNIHTSTISSTQTVQSQSQNQTTHMSNFTFPPMLKWFGGAAIIGSIIAITLIFVPRNNTENSLLTSAPASTTTSTDTPTQTSSPSIQPNIAKKEDVSNDDIRNFVKQYNESSMEALKNNDFSIVKPLLDPNGKMYSEQKDYLQYLTRKGISEETLKNEINDITRLDPTTYKVSTYEEYNITYRDGSIKFKSFNNDYLIKVKPDNALAVHAMIKNDQVESREVRSAVVQAIAASTSIVNEVDNSGIKSFVKQYVQNRIKAINENDLSLVSGMLLSDSEIYKLHERMVADYGSKGIKETLPALSINDAERIDINTYAVNTYETVMWHYLDGTTESRDFSFRYIVKYNGSTPLITERIDF